MGVGIDASGTEGFLGSGVVKRYAANPAGGAAGCRFPSRNRGLARHVLRPPTGGTMATVTYLPSALDAQINRAAHRINKERARKRWVATLVLLVGAIALTGVLWVAMH